MKSKFWATAIGCAFISFIITMEVIEKISYSHFLKDGKYQAESWGYQMAGILAFVGIAGIAIGIKILKKRQQHASGLIGFFLVPVVFAIIVFIFGP